MSDYFCCPVGGKLKTGRDSTAAVRVEAIRGGSEIRLITYQLGTLSSLPSSSGAPAPHPRPLFTYFFNAFLMSFWEKSPTLQAASTAQG